MADGYEVGYGKPPKHARFKPKQSGNPAGRPKGSRGLKTDLHDELNAKHTINLPGGKATTGRRQLLMIRTLTIRAATGDLKAAQLLLPLIQQAFGFEDRGVGKERLSPADQALLDELLAEGGETEQTAETDGVEVTEGTDNRFEAGDIDGDGDDLGGEVDFDDEGGTP